MSDLDLKWVAAELKLTAPVPSTRHPGAVYLASSGSRPTMPRSRSTITSLHFPIDQWRVRCPNFELGIDSLSTHSGSAVGFDFSLRASTTKKMMCALRRVLQEAHKLRLISLKDYTTAIDLPCIDTPPQKLRGRALSESELAALVDVRQTDCYL